jgi:hypothetical protein
MTAITNGNERTKVEQLRIAMMFYNMMADCRFDRSPLRCAWLARWEKALLKP